MSISTQAIQSKVFRVQCASCRFFKGQCPVATALFFYSDETATDAAKSILGALADENKGCLMFDRFRSVLNNNNGRLQ